MDKSLCSVGLDVGTTTTQMVVSRLQLQNCASGFAVPQMQIVSRQILYQSPVHLTPLKSQKLVDGQALRQLVRQEYENAGITPRQVDTGAVIITGETSRKENAKEVLSALSQYAGDFVVATAGPHLESVLAAKGAGATELSQKTGRPVLHMDIGGGTANLALLRDGQILATGCMNVGGRLVKTENGKVTYVSPAVAELTEIQVEDATDERLDALCEKLAQGLEMAAGLRPATALLRQLWTEEAGAVWDIPQEACILSFSGGVADCIETQQPDDAFGDIGVRLGKAIRNSRLCQGKFVLGKQTIRATVIGAGSYATTLSGSTVYCRDVALPLKNLPVIKLSRQQQESEDLAQLVKDRLRQLDTDRAVLALPGYQEASYARLSALAQRLATLPPPLLLCLETDMAKALGQCLQLRLPRDAAVLCIDGIVLQEQSFLDVAQPVGPCFPVVVKTLVLG